MPSSPTRVTRSISFEPAVLKHLKKRAAKLRRTVNWLVNELVRAEIANPAAAGTETS